MELLSRTENSGYPQDYLHARIRGHRSNLISDWEPLLAATDPLEALPLSPYRSTITEGSIEAGWKNLLVELAWLHNQMDRRLQNVFAPLFGWLELRTLILCLRNIIAERSGKIKELLQQSLLSNRLQKALFEGREPDAVINAAVVLLASDRTQQRKLMAAYHQDGLSGLERELTDRYLAETTADRLHPLIRDFLSRLIDSRNIITLYKQIRWQISKPPAFIAGGSLEVPTLSKLASRAGQEELTLLIRKLTRMDINAAVPESVEPLLLTWITRRVRRWGRNPSGPGMILDYIWRCYMEARNLGLLIHNRGADRELLRMELVR